jgi:hypothetical protein
MSSKTDSCSAVALVRLRTSSSLLGAGLGTVAMGILVDDRKKKGIQEKKEDDPFIRIEK